jgi:hypothetical protein
MRHSDGFFRTEALGAASSLREPAPRMGKCSKSRVVFEEAPGLYGVMTFICGDPLLRIQSEKRLSTTE